MIAAVYLDGGWESARRFVFREIGADIAASVAGVGGHDYKSLLQELAGRRGLGPPRYEVEEAGPDHAKVFTARVTLGVLALGEGTGRSKKQAEQAAAQRRVRRPPRATPKGGWPTMPELPEVETIKRDLEREIVGKRIKTVEVSGTRSIRRGTKKQFIGRLEGREGHGRPAQGQVPAAEAGHRRSARRPPAA